jgi:hypothetical protein
MFECSEDSIRASEGASNRRMDKTAQKGTSYFVLFVKYIRVMKSRGMRWEGACSTWNMRNAYTTLFGIYEGGRELERTRQRWKVCTIKLDHK